MTIICKDCGKKTTAWNQMQKCILDGDNEICLDCHDHRIVNYNILAEKLKKLERILNQDLVGWASPKVLIDTIKREVIDK